MTQKHAVHLPADERRAVTVQAVIELAAERNPGDITTAAIARHMGLTQGSLFRHFPNKDAILQAVVDWVAERMFSRIAKAIDGAASPLDALEAVFRTHVEFIVRHRGVPRMLIGELQRPEDTIAKRAVQALMRHYRERLQQLLTEAKTERQVAPNLDTDAAAVLFLGAVQGLVVQSLVSGDMEQMLHSAPGVFALYLHGIGAVRKSAA